jgi:hypothetical protein
VVLECQQLIATLFLLSSSLTTGGGDREACDKEACVVKVLIPMATFENAPHIIRCEPGDLLMTSWEPALQEGLLLSPLCPSIGQGDGHRVRAPRSRIRTWILTFLGGSGLNRRVRW